jgi:homoserine O-succinyltransferase/O-acetyltransferase
MPLIVEGGRVPPRWAERQALHPASAGKHASATDCVRIAFVNNMPDTALEDTEMQFFELLDAAAGAMPVRLKLHSLCGIPRGERGEQHVGNFYFSTNDLLNSRFDGVIMTGTEPRQSDLRQEPYWPALTNVLDWAETNTSSTILSCLAAHAGVLHSDGLNRYSLRDKQFGVFDFTQSGNHQFTNNTGKQIRFPHSRWNEVRAEELAASGYQVMTQSVAGGVDSFVKKKKQSMFLHFQGHPEYGAQTLLKEFRRDIKRFLRAERETYPSMPKGYFDATAAQLLANFQSSAVADRREELMEGFPETALIGGLRNTWHYTAIRIYRNWLQYVVTKKDDVAAFSVMAAAYPQSSRKRSATP